MPSQAGDGQWLCRWGGALANLGDVKGEAYGNIVNRWIELGYNTHDGSMVLVYMLT
jgi:hypothetical protein